VKSDNETQKKHMPKPNFVNKTAVSEHFIDFPLVFSRKNTIFVTEKKS